MVLQWWRWLMQHGVTSALQQSSAKHWQANLSSVAWNELHSYNNYNMCGYSIEAVRSTCFWIATINQSASFTLCKYSRTPIYPPASLRRKHERKMLVWLMFFGGVWPEEDLIKNNECLPLNCSAAQTARVSQELYCKQSIPSLLKNVHHALSSQSLRLLWKVL